MSSDSHRRRTLKVCAASGCMWAAIAWILGSTSMGRIVWGGMLASPLIGIAIGQAARPTFRLGVVARAFLALLSLYVAAALFGVAAGLYDLTLDIPGRIPHRVILQSVTGTLYGVTMTGYVLFLWPLAVFNHWLVRRVALAGR